MPNDSRTKRTLGKNPRSSSEGDKKRTRVEDVRPRAIAVRPATALDVIAALRGQVHSLERLLQVVTAEKAVIQYAWSGLSAESMLLKWQLEQAKLDARLAKEEKAVALGKVKELEKDLSTLRAKVALMDGGATASSPTSSEEERPAEPSPSTEMKESTGRQELLFGSLATYPSMISSEESEEFRWPATSGVSAERSHSSMVEPRLIYSSVYPTTEPLSSFFEDMTPNDSSEGSVRGFSGPP